MGMHPSARIIYGYIWPEEGTGPWKQHEEDNDLDDYDGEEDLIERTLKERGLENPWESSPDTDGLPWKEAEAIRDAWNAEIEDVMKAWYDAKATIPEELGIDGVERDFFGHCDYSAEAICIKATRLRTDWADEINPAEMVQSEEWTAQLARYVELTGVDLSEAEGPGWFLTTYYG